ncbi:MAG: Rossmann-like domain-containing protein [Lachnospiraceae bacterium]
MTADIFYDTLKQRFKQLLTDYEIGNETVEITCRALSPEEAIGKTKRRDFPILTGKDIMIQAEFRGCRGQAFTEAPLEFRGSLAEIVNADLSRDPYARGLYIATLNAVMSYLGKCTGTVHCRTDGPESCARDMYGWLRANYPDISRITLVGYQPALLEMLSGSEYQVRVLDLNPGNIGAARYGITVEDGEKARNDASEWADLILCTGSTVCNGTIVNYLDLDTEVVFFGTTLSGCAELMGLKRACFADRYSE